MSLLFETLFTELGSALEGNVLKVSPSDRALRRVWAKLHKWLVNRLTARKITQVYQK